MRRCYVMDNEEGGISILYVDKDTDQENDVSVRRALFEKSRSTDYLTPFNPVIHTLDAIALGIEGHRPLTCTEIAESDIPTDRYFRDAWEFVS